jgi:hypothetical protein
MVLVALTTTRKYAMKITIENPTVTTQPDTGTKQVPQIMDFCDARHLLALTGQETHSPKKITAQPVNGNRRPPTLGASPNLLDEALYWFISAPALGYLIYLVLGL